MSILNSTNSGKHSFKVTKEFLETRGYEVHDCFAIYKTPHILINSSPHDDYDYECHFVVNSDCYERCYTIPIVSVYVLELIEDVWNTVEMEEKYKKEEKLLDIVNNISVTRTKTPLVTQRPLY